MSQAWPFGPCGCLGLRKGGIKDLPMRLSRLPPSSKPFSDKGSRKIAQKPTLYFHAGAQKSGRHYVFPVHRRVQSLAHGDVTDHKVPKYASNILTLPCKEASMLPRYSIRGTNFFL